MSDLKVAEQVAAMSAQDAAAYWLVRQDTERFSQAERSEFDAWINASAAHREAFDRVNGVWRAIDSELDPKEAAVLKSAALEVAPRRRFPAALAASVLAAAIGVAIFLGWRPPGPVPQSGTREHYVTAQNQRTSLTLRDGSVITMNRDTDMEVAFTPEGRELTLQRGQAFFDVAKDAARPFSVATPHRKVTALGTQFEVRLSADSFEVTLLEGRVAVERTDEARAERVELRPNQRLIASGSGAAEVLNADARALSSWRNGILVFDNASVADAVREFNRYASSPIEVDPMVRALKVSGVFRIGERERFAATLMQLLPLKGERMPDGALRLSALDISTARH